ncbi:signal-induced proliferation-associated 1-like protein 1 isoform X1 [Sitophilus oryzae]|uniref:Signal-induced proliferation-associated 1-like protein 1 isoform X1 n=2 Tax=Sitophilus oryzae TaxID=7048 RepID=A0A6J2X3J5_SITOR|nr:signal-induced proliferation-associated 1-like protein 1 isoform X1 [Sitophilus oryzae]
MNDFSFSRDGMIGLQECGPAPPRAPLSTRTRDRTAQAIDYYNTHVHRCWANAGLCTSRSSFNDRHHHNARRPHLAPEALCRSNSSLELLDQHGRPFKSSSPTLRREYGSHGSIDVIDRPAVGQGKNEFFAMLQDYRPAVLGVADQRSPGPSEYLRGKLDSEDQHDGNAQGGHYPQSPKLKSKLTRFWSNGGAPGGINSANASTNNSMVKSQRSIMDDSTVSTASTNVLLSQEAEEIARRRAFAHYDCQSLTTNLNYSVRLRRNLLAKRRNTTTGASAASTLIRSSTPDGESEDDAGDGQSNELVQNCPFFRNEIGGEEERIVSLSRLQNAPQHRRPLHRPPLAYGVAILEFPPGETHWRHSTCPYQRFPRPIENVDQGALYYRNYFANHEHQNWFGTDEQLGPVAISIRREKVIHPDNQLTTTLTQYQYRILIRTSELQTLRGAVLEDAVPNIKASNNPKTLNTKEVLEYVAPEIQLTCLRLGLQNPNTVEQLLKLDEQGLTNNYKVGIMYCKAGQSTEEEMYNNEEAGPAFTEFLETIGKKVRLQNFDKYKAGLDNKTDSTGLYSVYAQYQDCEIMFHVSTMLPFTPNNRQQLLRKRHIGNDIVTIVFQEPGALPFTPKGIRSQFQHVFIVVNALNPCTENTHYKVAVSRSKDVEVFGPPIKEGAIFPKGKPFAEFLLAKVVNAENAAHRSEKFVTMATRTRQEYLKDLVNQYSSSTPLDTGQKFSWLSAIFSSKKKDKNRPRFIPDLCQRGAILWQVLLDDSGQGQQVECFLGISSDTFVLIEEQTRQIVFVTPCKSILGWSPQTNSLRIYHHQGECMTIHMRDTHGDTDELVEIINRLKAVTNGYIAKEIKISRNIMGQLGFHVQPDGVVTLVESQGQAWQSGLRQNSRLVEICKVAVATLTHDQMVDLLKTSLTVVLTVIPPLNDGTPRKGCTLQNCKYNETNFEGDYESTDENSKTKRSAQKQQAVSGNHRLVYERSFSPPRSSNSSGYGTGSSSKSFLGQEARYHANNVEGTMTSSSSGQSGDDKWIDFLQEFEAPPLPAKVTGSVRTPQHTNNTFPSSPKRNNYNPQPIPMAPTSHNHYTVHHSRVQFSNSLPLQHVNFQQPMTAALHSNTSDLDLSHRSEKNNIVKQHNERIRQQEGNEFVQITRTPKVADYTGDYLKLNDNLSNDSSISDRINTIGSEDELSTGSGNHSPRSNSRSVRQQQVSYNQRNQSPRATTTNGEAKLRPGVTSRSANRNSANLSSNNFKEELMRLINPDNIESASTSSSSPTVDQPKDISMSKGHSRENLNNSLSVHKSQPEVILTMARPATVISNASTTSSPLPNEFRMAKDEGLPSPSKNKVGLPLLDNFPLPVDSDWPSLVDTATRVMMQVESLPENENIEQNGKQWDDEFIGLDRRDQHLSSSYSSIPDQHKHVVELNRKIQTLERENRRLRDENQKFQEQAQAAVHQLRKFTEWFFKNVKRQ